MQRNIMKCVGIFRTLISVIMAGLHSNLLWTTPPCKTLCSAEYSSCMCCVSKHMTEYQSQVPVLIKHKLCLLTCSARTDSIFPPLGTWFLLNIFSFSPFFNNVVQSMNLEWLTIMFCSMICGSSQTDSTKKSLNPILFTTISLIICRRSHVELVASNTWK